MVTLIHPRPGDFLKTAYWYHSENQKEKEEAEGKITDAIFELAWEHKVRTKPIIWEHVTPDNPQVPEPPSHMMGEVKCAIGTAEVVGSLKMGPDFTEEIELPDLLRLRAATRLQFERAGGFDITDAEIDSIINEFAPEVAAKGIH